MRNAQSASLKYLYPVIVRITGISGIVLLIITFLLFPRITNKVELEEEIQIIIEQIDIPQTEQFDRPPPPARPSVPVESESEDIADDVTLEEGPRVKFIPYDDPPVPLRPIKPKYPEIAQEAGIEGTVVVQVFVDEKGRVKETVILKGIPNTGLDEAATDAIRIVRFKPAKQRERAVGVWISIPVNFRLKS